MRVMKCEPVVLRDVKWRQRETGAGWAAGYAQPCGRGVMKRWSSILTSQQSCQDVQTRDLTSPLHTVTSSQHTHILYIICYNSLAAFKQSRAMSHKNLCSIRNNPVIRPHIHWALLLDQKNIYDTSEWQHCVRICCIVLVYWVWMSIFSKSLQVMRGADRMVCFML